MDDLDLIIDKVILVVKDYEFDTFLFGANLARQIYEREDAMRAHLKIRGRESIKNQLTKELGLRLAKMIRRNTEYMKPDITICLTVDKENNVDVTTKSRPVVLNGRYTKKLRGMRQKQIKCPYCQGKGCGFCAYSGLSGYDSVEGVIAKGLMAKIKGETPKFSWLGSEDQNSLVLGSGRPFSVRIYNPKKRNLAKIMVKDKGVTARMALSEDVQDQQARFIVKTKIRVKCEIAIAEQDLRKLNSLAGEAVNFENKSKMATKKIYSIRARKIDDSEFTFMMVADGGLMIKQFVGGEEYMKPNISDILNAKCECVMFDVLDVKSINNNIS